MEANNAKEIDKPKQFLADKHIADQNIIYDNGTTVGLILLSDLLIEYSSLREKDRFNAKDAYEDVLRLLELGCDNKAHVDIVMAHIKDKIKELTSPNIKQQ